MSRGVFATAIELEWKLSIPCSRGSFDSSSIPVANTLL
eukprot:gene9366-biopygen15123